MQKSAILAAREGREAQSAPAPERGADSAEKIVLRRLHLLRNLRLLNVWSPAFPPYGRMPARYTADGAGLSPPLRWLPDPAAESYALLVEDADGPAAHPLVHALVVNLPKATHALAEGSLQSPRHDGTRIDPAVHRVFTQAWLPPHPPAQEEHLYAFQIFALRMEPGFAAAPGRQEFIEMLLEFAVAGGCLFGIHRRS